MKQTAVEWLFEKFYGSETFNHDEVLEEAKAMEKEQICDAFYYGVDVDSFCVNNPYKAAENYYKETYEAQEN